MRAVPAQAVGPLLLISEAGFDPKSVRVGFCVETNWHLDKFFSQYFDFPLSVSFHECSILIHSSITDGM